MAGDNLNREKLSTAEAVLTLGALAARNLRDHGVVTLFVDQEGEIQIALPGELQLDGLPEETAISTLVERGYDEAQLIAYLKGRDTRNNARGQHG